MGADTLYSCQFSTEPARDYLSIPLWISAPQADRSGAGHAHLREIYHHGVVGTKVAAVVVDGKPISPVLLHVKWDDFDCSVVQLETPFYVYQLVARRIDDYLPTPDRTGNNDYALLNVATITADRRDVVAYRIPHKAQSIKIEYRARYPRAEDGELGGLVTLVAERNDQPP